MPGPGALSGIVLPLGTKSPQIWDIEKEVNDTQLIVQATDSQGVTLTVNALRLGIYFDF